LRLGALILAAACFGCAGAGGDECRRMNWYQLGYSDGWGEHPQQIEGLARQCARHGVAAARSARPRAD